MIRPPKGRKPYIGTSVGVDQSKNQITKLLRDYGAEGVVWGDNFQTGEVNLRFAVQREDGRTTIFSITPAAFKEKHTSYDPVKGRSVTIEAPNWPRAMRLLHAWLKTKLESIAYGLTEVEEEFLAQMVVRDASGRETTAGELILPAIEQGGGRLALEPPRKRENVVDAESGPA
ncbi:MAG: hypothetical protein IVW52_05090 [Acidimicrobiales bacterium]|nr:hypothetical protein [Acidimicrobiales bacterium]